MPAGWQDPASRTPASGPSGARRLSGHKGLTVQATAAAAGTPSLAINAVRHTTRFRSHVRG